MLGGWQCLRHAFCLSDIGRIASAFPQTYTEHCHDCLMVAFIMINGLVCLQGSPASPRYARRG